MSEKIVLDNSVEFWKKKKKPMDTGISRANKAGVFQ